MKGFFFILLLVSMFGCSTETPDHPITYLPEGELAWTKEMIVGRTFNLDDLKEVLWLRFHEDSVAASFGPGRKGIVWMGDFVWKIENGRLMLMPRDSSSTWRSFGLIHIDAKSVAVEESGKTKRFTIE